MTFRFATEEDCSLILSFIRYLAEYEKMSDQVVATEELLREWIFGLMKTDPIHILAKGRSENFRFENGTLWNQMRNFR